MATPEELRRKTEEALARQKAEAGDVAAKEKEMEQIYQDRADILYDLEQLKAERAADGGKSRLKVMQVMPDWGGVTMHDGFQQEGYDIPSDVAPEDRRAMAHPEEWLTGIAKYFYQRAIADGYKVTFQWSYGATHEFYWMWLEW